MELSAQYQPCCTFCIAFDALQDQGSGCYPYARRESGYLIVEKPEQTPASDYPYGWEQDPVLCKRFPFPSGCSMPYSYSNQFYQTFWKDIYEEWETGVDRPAFLSYEEDWRLLEMLYKKHRELFPVLIMQRILKKIWRSRSRDLYRIRLRQATAP
jgi:hypothetical protein